MKFTTVLAISIAALMSSAYALPTSINTATGSAVATAGLLADESSVSFVAGGEEADISVELERRSPEPKKKKKKKKGGKKGKKGKKGGKGKGKKGKGKKGKGKKGAVADDVAGAPDNDADDVKAAAST